MYCTRPAAYATSGRRSPVTSRATWTKLLKCELRMKRPRALAGRTPMSSRVRIVEPGPAVGVGIGEPWMIACGDAGAAAATIFIDVVSGPGPFDAVARRGSTAPPAPGVGGAGRRAAA